MIPVWFIVFIAIPLVSYFFLGKWKESEKMENRASLLAEETLGVDHKGFCSTFPVQFSKNGVHQCAHCSTSAKNRCSRCKAVYYCCGRCQIDHWRHIHKFECLQYVKNFLPSRENFKYHEISMEYPFQYNVEETSVCNAGLQDVIPPTLPTIPSVPDLSMMSGSYGSSFPGYFDAGHINLQEKNMIDNLEVMKQSKNIDYPKQSIDTVDNHTKTKMIFSYAEFVKYFRFEVLGMEPRGLVNCGNSCYANAVLQCLMFTKPLIIYFLSQSHSMAGCPKDWCLMCEFEQLALMLWESGGPLSPINILTYIRSCTSQIGDESPEDAHEFLRLVISSMQSICLESFGGEHAVDPELQDTTFIHHTFGGCLRSKVTCLTCNCEFVQHEKMMDLTLELYGQVESLEDALIKFTSAEHLDGENMYKCSRCAMYVRARKQLNIQSSPNILTIVLKRFQEGNGDKINKYIAYPEILDMVPFMIGNDDVPPPYFLYAILVHLDIQDASSSGHYIAYVKDTQGNWSRVDDTKVQPVDLSQVMSEKAYILFYMRSSPHPIGSSEANRQ